MSQNNSVIEKLCKFIFIFSNIDTIFIDSSSNLKFEFGYTQVPEPLKQYFGTVYDILNNSETFSEYNIAFISTPYKLNFIYAKIYDSSEHVGNIIIGPYLIEEPTPIILQDVLFENKLPISLRHTLTQYYLSLPLISTYKAKSIAEFLAYFASDLNFIKTQTPNIENITYTSKSEQHDALNTVNKNNETPMDLIEKRYYTENEVMHAVENGDKEKVSRLFTEDFLLFNSIPDRIPNDPLRSRKNLGFVLNTLLRTAAKRGGLSPTYIHSLSEKFAIQIEKASSIQQIIDLQKDMLLGYSDAVRKFALKNFSYSIRKAIEFIRANLDQDLSLNTISDAIGISSFELSRQFKKETGEGITEYINKQRISEAVYLMENNNISITDIAYMAGFNDVNYFTKVFKKIKGVTPSEYRKNNT